MSNVHRRSDLDRTDSRSYRGQERPQLPAVVAVWRGAVHRRAAACAAGVGQNPPAVPTLRRTGPARRQRVSALPNQPVHAVERRPGGGSAAGNRVGRAPLHSLLRIDEQPRKVLFQLRPRQLGIYCWPLNSIQEYCHPQMAQIYAGFPLSASSALSVYCVLASSLSGSPLLAGLAFRRLHEILRLHRALRRHPNPFAQPE